MDKMKDLIDCGQCFSNDRSMEGLLLHSSEKHCHLPLKVIVKKQPFGKEITLEMM